MPARFEEVAFTVKTFRLSPRDYATLRQMAGPRGSSAFVRALIRSEAARRELMEPKREKRQ